MGDFESWMKGALRMKHLSLKWLCGGGAPSLGTLADMLKSLDVGISLHGGPFPSEGNLVCRGGGGFIPETLRDE